MTQAPLNRTEVISGLMFMGIGSFSVAYTISELQIGSANQMGPGYFPMMLGLVLIALGFAIVLTGGFQAEEVAPPVPWRGLVLITASPILFALCIAPLGLFLATIISVFFASLASSEINLRRSLLIALAMGIICSLMVSTLLSSQIPVFGTLFGVE